MKTTFYVFKYGNGYIKVSKNLKLSLTKDIDKCSYWDSKKNANSWKNSIETKYPGTKLIECGICEK